MDCEQFELIVVDVLYGELPEAEAAAARRHIEHCDRCAAILSSLRSARKAASMPLEEPPGDLEASLVAEAKSAQKHAPWPRRVGRAISWAGSYAMRPQLAMAALLLLMIGSSLLLLRGRPGSQVGVVHVTEQGVPDREHADLSPSESEEQTRRRGATSGRSEAEGMAASRAAGDASTDGVRTSAGSSASPAGMAEAARTTEFDDAMAIYEAKEYAKAQKAFEAIAAQGGADAHVAALYAAKSAKALAGCGAALPRFEAVIARHGTTTSAVQARWEAAACNRSVGNYDRARQHLADLRNIEGQRDRADQELARLGPAPRGARAADRRPAAAAPAKTASPRATATQAY